MSVTLRVTPVVTLLGVSPKEVAKKYQEGYFLNLKLPRIRGNIKIGNSGLIRKVYDNNPEKETFSYHSKSGAEYIFLSTDHKKYECVHLDKSYQTKGKCRTCMRMYSDRIMIGIPYRVTMEYRNNQYLPIFWCKGTFCSFPCALYHVLLIGRGCHLRNISAETAESNLRMMFALTYPKAGRLGKCNDPELLEENGGPVAYEDWVDQDYVFQDTGNLVMYPAKTVYQQV